MMGDWQGTVSNFGKDQRMLLRDLSDKRKKIERVKQDVGRWLDTPGPMGPRGRAGLPGVQGIQSEVQPRQLATWIGMFPVRTDWAPLHPM